MAGKKNKGEAKGQSRRGAGALQSSGVDDITRRLNGMQGQDEVTAQQETLSLAAPTPGEAIQEQNLKAALDSPNIYVETTDNDGVPSVVEIEREVALLSPYVQREVLQQGNGVSHDKPIILPNKVTLEILELLLTYCRFHRASGRSDKERKIFDEKFIRLDTRRLCELTSAADALAMKPLVDLTSRALARLIEGKTPEQIRAQFQLPDDLTEEEKLEPVRNFGDDPKIRLLNRLYEKKRRELQKRREEEQKLISEGAAPTLTMEEKRQQDERSVDELLSFIENDGAASTSTTPRGSKKKKGKQSRKLSPSQDAQHNSSTPVPSAQHSASMQGRQNAVPPPAFDQHHSLYPSSSSSVPVARKLASTVDVQKSSTEAEQRETSNSSKPDSRDVKPLAPSVGNGDHTSLKQNGLEQPQQPLDTHGKAQQPRQQRVNGLTNRHLSEEEDAEDAQHNKDDNASEASDGDDIEDEEDDEEEDEAAQSSYQMHRRELLSGSFGPLQGPLTTLTSLAAFKARMPAPQSMAQDADEEQASHRSAPAPAKEEQSSAAGLQGNRAGQPEKQSEAGHDRQQSRSANRSDKNASAAGQHGDTKMSRLWEDPADVDTAHAALEAFLRESGLSNHMQIKHIEAQESSREQRSRATEAPQSQNGLMQHAVEHRAELSTGYALELKLLQGL
ncbi:g4088 [Coccomyxa viridis]|uniref:G4088 protein n=1 Tax=Coccomyxa viridis TaxID=1274662 RepID=A0ABP1FPE2_9CHLO